MRTYLISAFLLFSLCIFAKEKLVYIELTTNEKVVYQFNYYDGKKMMCQKEFIDTIVGGVVIRTALNKTMYYYERGRVISTKKFNYYPTIKVNGRKVYIINKIVELNTTYKYE